MMNRQEPIIHDIETCDCYLCQSARAKGESQGLKKRIAKLEAQVAGYERLLDEAFNKYLSGCTGYEFRDILKAMLEYAPRRNWEEKWQYHG